MERPRILRLLASLALGLIVVLAGFASGLLVGVVSEEPDLLLAHLNDTGEVVRFDREVDESTPSVAAAPPQLPPRDPAVAPADEQEVGIATRAKEVAPAAATDAPSGARDTSPAVLPGSRKQPASPPSRAPAQPIAARNSSAVPRDSAVSDPADAPAVYYAVQVGAFESSQAAESLAGTLRRKGYPVQIVPSIGERTQRWRVRVAPLDSREAADADAVRLKGEELLPTWVLQVQ